MPNNINSWVVYRMTVQGKKNVGNAVCNQTEWDAMELARPGQHELIRGGIANEGEAEQLARIPIPPAAATVA